MNHYQHLRKLGIGALLILLLTNFSLAVLRAQAQDTTHPLEPTSALREAIAQQFALVLANRPDWLMPGDDPFAIDTLRIDGNYAFFNAIRYRAVESEATQVDQLTPDGETEAHEEHWSRPDILLAIAVLDQGQWTVYLEGTPEYNDYLMKLPDTLVDQEAKNILFSQQPSGKNEISAAATTAAYKLSGLPWKAGETWKYAQDMHGTANNGFDFGTLNGAAGAVYTADTGTVILASSTCVEIKRAGGLRHGYQHIDANDVASFAKKYLGKTVAKGIKIGMTTTKTGCGGVTGGHHIHFYLYDESTKSNMRAFMPFGSSINGWTFSVERDYSEKEASGGHPKSGYDYPMKKGNQIACAGTTTQNGRNICTTQKIYHDPHYRTVGLANLDETDLPTPTPLEVEERMYEMFLPIIAQ